MDFQFVESLLYSVVISLPRLVAAFAVIPFLSRKVFTGTLIRNGFALALAIVLVPLNFAQYTLLENLTPFLGFMIIIKEIFIGAIIGFLVAIPFWAVEAMGFIIDNQRGSTMASSLNPLSGDQTSTTGLLLNQMMTVLFFSSGAVLIFLGFLYKSFIDWPIFQLNLNFHIDHALFFLSKLDDLMMLAVVLSGPAVIAMFITEFCFALVNRFTPQLDVFILSMSVKSMVAFFTLVFYVGSVVVFFEDNATSFNLVFKQIDSLYFD